MSRGSKSISSSICGAEYRRLLDNETALDNQFYLPAPTGINDAFFPDNYDDEGIPEPEYTGFGHYADKESIMEQLLNGVELNVSMSLVSELVRDGAI